MNAQQEIVRNGEALSYYINTKNRYGQPVNTPVIDVRDGIAERLLAMSIIKKANRSTYINFNEYHVSHKKPNQ